MTEPTDTTQLRTAAEASEFDIDLIVAFIKATSHDWRRVHRVRGATFIHEWLSHYPGNTWQERWVAADGDANIEGEFLKYQASHSPTPSQAKTNHPRYLRHGLSTLIGLGLLRPGPGYLLQRNSKVACNDVLDRHGDQIEDAIARSARTSSVSVREARDARYAMAAMIATTGRPLAEVTVEDWAAADATRSDLLRPFRAWERTAVQARAQGVPYEPIPAGMLSGNSMLSLRWSYSAVARAGVLAPHPHPAEGSDPLPPTLNMARAKPRNTQSLLEPYEVTLSGRLYDFVTLVLDEHYTAHDFNTKVAVVSYLNIWVQSARVVHPTPEPTLRIPRSHSTRLVEEMRSRPERGNKDRRTNREALPMLLQSVRRFYELAHATIDGLNEQREEQQQHGEPTDIPDYSDLISPFPIPRHVVRTLSKKYRKQTKSRLNEEIRIRITSIDDIVPVADRLADDTEALLAAALATETGDCFTHNDVEYRRHDTPIHPASRHPLIHITRTDRHTAPRDVSRIAHRARRTCAFVTLLRHTGMRREEAIEVAQDDLTFAQIDGAKDVPCLYVQPAKTDTSRTVALHREAVRALVALINSHKTLYGEVPMAVRKDHYERVILKPRRYLFQNLYDGAFTVPDISIFAEWVRDMIDDHNLLAEDLGQPKIQPLRPHDFRRIFATDLLDKDVPIESVRQLLGHANIATTAVYDHTTWDRAASQFLDAQRAANRRSVSTPCPHCEGTGIILIPTEPGS